MIFCQTVYAQGKRVPAAAGREEFIEVEKNVKLHVTDLGDGQPIVLIHGWPLSDAMYEYQYAALIKNGYILLAKFMSEIGVFFFKHRKR